MPSGLPAPVTMATCPRMFIGISLLQTYVGAGICCTAHEFPSGSLKKTKEPQGWTWTSPVFTPRLESSRRTASRPAVSDSSIHVVGAVGGRSAHGFYFGATEL